MRVPTVEPRTRTDSVRQRRTDQSSGADFSEALRSAAATTTSNRTTSVATSLVSAVLTVQHVGDATDWRSRRRAVRRADALLDDLDRLRRDLLAGEIPPERLSALLERLREREEAPDDPHLAEVVAEIELRVEVELAKHGRGR